MKNVLTRALPLFALPVIALAQNLGPFMSFVSQLKVVFDMLIPVLIGLAMVAFFWGLVRFIFSAGDEEARKNGKQLMIWGIIGVFIMVAFWGIINFLIDIAGVNNQATPSAPDVPST